MVKQFNRSIGQITNFDNNGAIEIMTKVEIIPKPRYSRINRITKKAEATQIK